jgi:hypothetical protein
MQYSWLPVIAIATAMQAAAIPEPAFAWSGASTAHAVAIIDIPLENVRSTYPRFVPGRPYSRFRNRLRQNGWKPASTPDADRCDQGDTRCTRRPEMQSCAGTGEANCLFRWRKGGIIIEVSTVGDPPTISAVECRAGCP